MDKILNWINKHKVATLFICITLFVFPLIIVHLLFKWGSGAEWKPEIAFLAAEWTAGDVLAYIAGFEAFIGTVVLGLVTVDQSQKANKENERLSKENNFLQKISVQNSLPLVRVASIEVHNSCTTTPRYFKEKSSLVEVADTVTPDKRETHLRTYLPFLGKQSDQYSKVVKLALENISDSAISQIIVNHIDFSGFKFQNNTVPEVRCVGSEYAKYISWLLLPKESLTVTLDIYFDNALYKDFWEYEHTNSIGQFEMCLYITNRSLSGIECSQKIYISKAVGFAERVMYKAGNEDIHI